MGASLLDLGKVEEGSRALLEVLKNDRLSTTKKLLDVPAPIFLQIDFVKIPKVKRQVMRIPLKNNVLTEESDVCLIVADIIRGRNVNHEVTLNHYKKLFEKKGIEDAQKLHVMSSRQIRVDYSTFEAKRKLCKMYDVFLIDNKISAYLRPKLGKEFPKSRKWPIPIRMKRKNLKEEILSKLKKTSLALDGSGTTKTVQVGHVNMTPREVAENIVHVGEYIAERFPGGWDNIRSLHVKGLRSAALPIFVSMVSKNDVSKPIIEMKRRKRILAAEEVSIVGKKVIVYRSGRVKVLRDKAESDEDDADAISAKPETKKRKFEGKKKTIQGMNHDGEDVPKAAEKSIQKSKAKKRKMSDDTEKTIKNQEKKTSIVPLQEQEIGKQKKKGKNKKMAQDTNCDNENEKISVEPVQKIDVEKPKKKDKKKKTVQSTICEDETQRVILKKPPQKTDVEKPKKKDKKKKTVQSTICENKTQRTISKKPSVKIDVEKSKKKDKKKETIQSTISEDETQRIIPKKPGQKLDVRKTKTKDKNKKAVQYAKDESRKKISEKLIQKQKSKQKKTDANSRKSR